MESGHCGVPDSEGDIPASQKGGSWRERKPRSLFVNSAQVLGQPRTVRTEESKKQKQAAGRLGTATSGFNSRLPTAERQREDVESSVSDNSQGQRTVTGLSSHYRYRQPEDIGTTRSEGWERDTGDPEFYIQQEDPVKVEENTDVSDK